MHTFEAAAVATASHGCSALAFHTLLLSSSQPHMHMLCLYCRVVSSRLRGAAAFPDFAPLVSGVGIHPLSAMHTCSRVVYCFWDHETTRDHSRRRPRIVVCSASCEYLLVRCTLVRWHQLAGTLVRWCVYLFRFLVFLYSHPGSARRVRFANPNHIQVPRWG